MGGWNWIEERIRAIVAMTSDGGDPDQAMTLPVFAGCVDTRDWM
jgi:hypothetical protein